MRLAVVIPTYNRPDDLRKCLESVFGQSRLPDEVLVVDDGEICRDFLASTVDRAESLGVRFIYHRKDHSRVRRGLSESRNLAMYMVDCPFLVLDDDIVLDPDCLKAMEQAWEESDDGRLLGVGGVIRNNRRISRLERLYRRIFCLDSDRSWDVNRVGFQVWDDWIGERTEGHYAHSGFCLFGPEQARRITFPVFQGGRPGLEDVHFSLKAKGLGLHYVIEPAATCEHFHSPVSRDRQYDLGWREGYNRRIIFNDYCDGRLPNRLRFAWASFGWTLRQFLSGNFRKGFGTVAGSMSRRKDQ